MFHQVSLYLFAIQLENTSYVFIVGTQNVQLFSYMIGYDLENSNNSVKQKNDTYKTVIKIFLYLLCRKKMIWML